MRGRKPKPVELHRLHGSYRADRHSLRVARLPGEVPDKPSWLPAEASAEWDRIAPILAPLGLLTLLDRAALAAYCLLWDDLRAASEKIQRDGLTCTSADGVERLSPWTKVSKSAAVLLLRYAAEFGMTPAARTRLRIELAEIENDPFEEFLKGKGVM